jgi:hypothetical protein
MYLKIHSLMYRCCQCCHREQGTGADAFMCSKLLRVAAQPDYAFTFIHLILLNPLSHSSRFDRSNTRDIPGTESVRERR